MKLTGGTLLIAMSFALWPSAAHAYIDPSAGALVLQGLLAGLAGVTLFFGRIRTAVGRAVARLKGKTSTDARNPKSDQPE